MRRPPGRVMAMAAAFRRLYLPSARSKACTPWCSGKKRQLRCCILAHEGSKYRTGEKVQVLLLYATMRQTLSRRQSGMGQKQATYSRINLRTRAKMHDAHAGIHARVASQQLQVHSKHLAQHSYHKPHSCEATFLFGASFGGSRMIRSQVFPWPRASRM